MTLSDTGRQVAGRPDAVAQLPLVGRLLLTSDGTITAMLEQITGERVIPFRIEHTPAEADPDVARLLEVADCSSLLVRETLLRGAVSERVYVEARSILALDAVPPRLRNDLLSTDEPIGRLLRRHRIESFREIVSVHVPQGDEPAEPSRQYLIHTQGVPTLLIEELFTRACFLDDF